MSLMAVLITFAAMAVFSGLLIAIATMRSAQISQELETWSAELTQNSGETEYVDEPVPAAPKVSSIVYS